MHRIVMNEQFFKVISWINQTEIKNKQPIYKLIMRREAARYELVDLPFTLVLVPGRRLIYILGHRLKGLGTPGTV